MKNHLFSTIQFPVLLLAFMIAACGGDSGTRQTATPNIVIIFADDMGYGDISCLNPESGIRTRSIDELAGQGIIFSEAHSSASVCTPSRYGLLTGRYAFRSPRGSRVVYGFNGPVIEKDRETIASVLKRAGYSTACIGKWHLGVTWQAKDKTKELSYDRQTGRSNVDYGSGVLAGPNDFGFDYSFILPASLDMPPYLFLRDHQVTDPRMSLTSDRYPLKLDTTVYAWDRKHTREQDIYWGKGVWWRQGEISHSFDVENCLQEIFNEGISYIGKHAREQPDEPFFLYLPLTAPHTPWTPSDQFRGKSSAGTYGEFVMDIDHGVGRIVEQLRKSGLYENTMIIFSSDNGAYWPDVEIELTGHESNRGRRGQKGDVWDGGHHVPLIISWPEKIRKGSRYEHLVSLTDLFATLADLTGMEIESGNGEDSFSFLPALEGDMSEAIRASMIHHSSRGLYSIRNGKWKYINGLGSGGFTAPAQVEPVPGGAQGQLYRIVSDSLESTNLYLEYPDTVEMLKNELKQDIKTSLK
jgi:arylsulfatase A-like enzyme